MDQFISLLNIPQIEKAIEMYMEEDVRIIFNGKLKKIGRREWVNFLKRKFLNSFTRIVQFKITAIEKRTNKFSFLIHMVCKRFNGSLFFTEIYVENLYENNLIYQANYTITNH